MANINDVARRAGVSTATVSRALANPVSVRPETRDAVLEAVKALGYVPNRAARNLRARSSRMILVVVPWLTNSFFPPLFRGLEKEATRQGYGTILSEQALSTDQQARLLDMAGAGFFDGAILFAEPMQQPGARSLATADMPVVYAAMQTDATAHAVCVREREAVIEQTIHLLAHGHRRFLYVSGGAGNPNDIQRYDGFLTALAEAGIGVDGHVRVEGDWSYASGYAAGDAWLDLHARGGAPTAVFAIGDIMAIGFMRRLLSAGIRIPEDVSVVGFDGIEATLYCHPTLTTVEQPAEAMGAAAARLTIDLLEGRDAPRRIDFEGTLRIGESSGPAPR